jgi:oxygen-dependent protoporphyrinogen oxidase
MQGVFDVAVVGGGISGLAAAYELQRRGLNVCVLEASSRAGGVICTERFDGWVVDGGPDSILVQKPAAVALCRELGIADRLVSTLPPRTAYILRDDRLHRIAEGSFLGFPLDARSLARSSVFSLGGRLRMACELFMPRRGGDEDESIGTFVRRRFGDEAVQYLAEPLLAGIHAGDVDRLSTQALFPRLLEAERQSGSVLRAFRAMQAKPSPQGAFVSFPGGTGELVDALLQALTPGTVRTSTRVLEIHRHATYRAETHAGPVQAQAIILAVPAYVAASLRKPSLTLRPLPSRSDTIGARSRIRWKAAASWCRASSEARCSRRPGSHRNGRIVRRTVRSFCAVFSAVAAIHGGWTRPTRSSSAWWSTS